MRGMRNGHANHMATVDVEMSGKTLPDLLAEVLRWQKEVTWYEAKHTDMYECCRDAAPLLARTLEIAIEAHRHHLVDIHDKRVLYFDHALDNAFEQAQREIETVGDIE